jgi:hypothetical protein
MAATAAARPLEIELLCGKLDADYAARIQGVGNSPEARRNNFLSRAIAAFVLHEDAGVSIDEAVASSVDGGQDHGLDSIHVGADQTIWIVQSKYKDTGLGEPELADVLKFCDGIKDLLHGRWERFNEQIRAKRTAITNALNGGVCRIKAILAYSGTAVSDDRRQAFDDLERAFNSTNPGLVRCHAYGLTTLHDLHVDGVSAEPIEADIELRDFGHVGQPYRAFYGRVEAKRLAQLWIEYGDRLVGRNIRRFKGSTTVNSGLTHTLRSEAQHFFYFNNGVTFLCELVQQQHPLDATRQRGTFRVRGLSIINGAQTVGAIAREALAHYDTHPSEVTATFVSLEHAPEDFGEHVTQSRNRQNAVDLEDFAALDERQEAWRKTLGMAGVTYVVRHGDDDPLPSGACFGVREAAPFLACGVTASDWDEFVVAAKADRKRLFGRPGLVAAEDALRDAYNRLFVDSLTARRMWRQVQIGRAVHEMVRNRAEGESDPTTLPAGALPAKEILRHGAWLLLHVLTIRLSLQHGQSLVLTAEEQTAISREVDSIAQIMVEVVQAVPWGKDAQAIFEDRADCRAVKERVMARLAQRG